MASIFDCPFPKCLQCIEKKPKDVQRTELKEFFANIENEDEEMVETWILHLRTLFNFRSQAPNKAPYVDVQLYLDTGMVPGLVRLVKKRSDDFIATYSLEILHKLCHPPVSTSQYWDPKITLKICEVPELIDTALDTTLKGVVTEQQYAIYVFTKVLSDTFWAQSPEFFSVINSFLFAIVGILVLKKEEILKQVDKHVWLTDVIRPYASEAQIRKFSPRLRGMMQEAAMQLVALSVFSVSHIPVLRVLYVQNVVSRFSEKSSVFDIWLSSFNWEADPAYPEGSKNLTLHEVLASLMSFPLFSSSTAFSRILHEKNLKLITECVTDPLDMALRAKNNPPPPPRTAIEPPAPTATSMLVPPDLPAHLYKHFGTMPSAPTGITATEMSLCVYSARRLMNHPKFIEVLMLHLDELCEMDLEKMTLPILKFDKKKYESEMPPGREEAARYLSEVGNAIIALTYMVYIITSFPDMARSLAHNARFLLFLHHFSQKVLYLESAQGTLKKFKDVLQMHGQCDGVKAAKKEMQFIGHYFYSDIILHKGTRPPWLEDEFLTTYMAPSALDSMLLIMKNMIAFATGTLPPNAEKAEEKRKPFDIEYTTHLTAEKISEICAARAAKLKEEGNKEFGEEEYVVAAYHYTHAIRLALPHGDPKALPTFTWDTVTPAASSLSTDSPSNPDLYVYYSNRAQCYLRLKEWNCAKHDAEEALRLHPGHEKSILRLNEAKKHLDFLTPD